MNDSGAGLQLAAWLFVCCWPVVYLHLSQRRQISREIDRISREVERLRDEMYQKWPPAPGSWMDK